MNDWYSSLAAHVRIEDLYFVQIGVDPAWINRTRNALWSVGYSSEGGRKGERAKESTMNGMAYTDVQNEERKEDQWLLGVCRIRRKGIGRRPDETLGFGFLVKDLIIPNPTSSFKYCLITATQSIDAKDSSQSYYLEFKKLNSKVKTVPLRKIADLQEAFRAYNLLFIRLKEPPSKCYKKKESIFTYRPFEVTNENQITSTDLLCVLVEDKEKSFDAIDLKIQRRTEQNSDKITFEVIEYQNVLTTRSELIRNKNRMPDGGVILMHQENKDKRFKAVGCLDFADDGSICPVFFPLIPISMFNIRYVRHILSLTYDVPTLGCSRCLTSNVKIDPLSLMLRYAKISY